MKKFKIVAMTFMLILTVLILCACSDHVGNRVISGQDVQTFTYAYIRLGDQTIVEGYISQWRDYSDSDVVQIMIDGKYYLTHYSCVVMIADPLHWNLEYSETPLQDRRIIIN